MELQPKFDIDLDKHYNATLVIACNDCGRANKVHLRALTPDVSIRCHCGTQMGLTPYAITRAQQQVQHLKQAYGV